MKFYYQNVRGLKTKVKNFLSNLIVSSYDVILLSETWLNEDFFSSELFDSRYVVYRKDRDRVMADKVDGGGCLIAVKKEFRSKRLSEWELERGDVWVSIEKKDGSKAFFNVKYMELGSNLDCYLGHFERISEVVLSASKNDSFFLTGDYNLNDSVTWSYEPVNNACDPTDVRGSIPSALIDMLSFCDMKQLSCVRNVTLGRTLDLIISNLDPQKLIVSKASSPLVQEDGHHPAIEVKVDFSPLKFMKERKEPRTNFFKANYVSLNEKLLGIDWENELGSLDVDSAVDRFYEILKPLVDSIPKTRCSNREYPVFYTPSLISLIKQKDNARLSCRRELCPVRKEELRRKYSDLRKQVKREIEECFDDYVNDCEEKLKSNTKCFFAFTKSLKRTNSLPDSMRYGDDETNDRFAICNLFANFFKSVYNARCEVSVETELVCDPFSHQDESVSRIGCSHITEAQVRESIKRFNVNKVASPDALPMLFFFNLSLSLSLPLSILFNKSLVERKFPTKWKTSFVSPIYKEGKKDDVENYRAVSIMCAISKIFERLVFVKLFELVKDKIVESQHGFVAGRSTQSNLMDYVSIVAHEVVNGGQVDTIYTDFTKAFDKVDHGKLITKLRCFGFDAAMLEWFRSYLSDRSQFVVIGDSRSERIVPTSGVPQGSILGPFLFIVFINDLLASLNSCYGFADDLKVFRAIKEDYDCDLLQGDLVKIHNWCIDNKMILNLKKCAVMSTTHSTQKRIFDYGLNGMILERVSVKKDLGIMLDDKLSFNHHVEMITKKAYQMLGFIFRCGKYFRNKSSLMILYKSLVRNRLEYCSSVWNPQYDRAIQEIERVQKKFTRMFFFKFNMGTPRPVYIARLRHLKLHSLESRRRENDEINLYKIIHKHIDSRSLYQHLKFHQPIRSTRQNRLISGGRPRKIFYLPRFSTNYEENAPINRLQCKHDEFFFNIDIFDNRFPFVKRRIRSYFEY